MRRLSRYGLLSAALGTMILLPVTIRQHRANPTSSTRPFDDWNIIDLVEHLNRMGMKLQIRSTSSNGALGQTVFLTTAHKHWIDLNSLNKDPKRIHEWQGVIYCERVKGDTTLAVRLWGDHCLAVEPFLFYGDAELLQGIRAALTEVAQPPPRTDL
jgi:hypothetical protein